MQLETLQADLQQARQAPSQQQADLQQQQSVQAAPDQHTEQAFAHAKEISELTEAHTQLQNLVNTLTEENMRLDQANSNRSMHIGSLTAGLDQVKRTQSDKSSASLDLLPEAGQHGSSDESSAQLSSELAHLQGKQSSHKLQVIGIWLRHQLHPGRVMFCLCTMQIPD